MPRFWKEISFQVSRYTPIILKCICYQHSTYVHLNTCFYWSCPCDSPVGEFAPIKHVIKIYNAQAGEQEGGKGSGFEYLSDHQYGIETTARDRNISTADIIWKTMWGPERIHILPFSRIQHRKILNADEGILRVHREQVQLKIVHTSVLREWNEDRSPIADKSDW